MGDGDIDVDAVALWARRVHLLEPERRPLPGRVGERLVAVVDIPQDGPPERPHGRDVDRVDGDLELRHDTGLGRDAEVAGDR